MRPLRFSESPPHPVMPLAAIEYLRTIPAMSSDAIALEEMISARPGDMDG